MSQFKTREFQKLKSKWTEKLNHSGFQDIEKDEYRLKEHHSTRFTARYTPEEFKENERYWQLAGQLLHEYPFLDNKEKKIWKMYSEGEHFRKISKACRVSVSTIYRTVNRIAKAIKL